MSPEEQRIAIAEACGVRTDRPSTGWHDHGCPCQQCHKIPYYLNDLNAMHEAEKTLDDELDLDYSENLEIATGARWGTNNSCDMSKYRSATAAQRAEAFLKTIGQWKD